MSDWLKDGLRGKVSLYDDALKHEIEKAKGNPEAEKELCDMIREVILEMSEMDYKTIKEQIGIYAKWKNTPVLSLFIKAVDNKVEQYEKGRKSENMQQDWKDIDEWIKKTPMESRDETIRNILLGNLVDYFNYVERSRKNERL